MIQNECRRIQNTKAGSDIAHVVRDGRDSAISLQHLILHYQIIILRLGLHVSENK